MSYFYPIYRSELSHRARSVYMCLKDHANKDDKCWPGIKTIANELNLSRSTVKRALDDLYRAELVTKAPRKRENGGNSSNLYHLTPHPRYCLAPADAQKEGISSMHICE